jgi:hypothetical protein
MKYFPARDIGLSAWHYSDVFCYKVLYVCLMDFHRKFLFVCYDGTEAAK